MTLLCIWSLTLTFPTKLSSRHLSSTFMNCKQLNIWFKIISKTFLVGIIVNFIQDEIFIRKRPRVPESNPRQARPRATVTQTYLSLQSKIKMHRRLPADASTLLWTLSLDLESPLEWSCTEMVFYLAIFAEEGSSFCFAAILFNQWQFTPFTHFFRMRQPVFF